MYNFNFNVVNCRYSEGSVRSLEAFGPLEDQVDLAVISVPVSMSADIMKKCVETLKHVQLDRTIQTGTPPVDSMFDLIRSSSNGGQMFEMIRQFFNSDSISPLVNGVGIMQKYKDCISDLYPRASTFRCVKHLPREVLRVDCPECCVRYLSALSETMGNSLYHGNYSLFADIGAALVINAALECCTEPVDIVQSIKDDIFYLVMENAITYKSSHRWNWEVEPLGSLVNELRLNMRKNVMYSVNRPWFNELNMVVSSNVNTDRFKVYNVIKSRLARHKSSHRTSSQQTYEMMAVMHSAICKAYTLHNPRNEDHHSMIELYSMLNNDKLERWMQTKRTPKEMLNIVLELRHMLLYRRITNNFQDHNAVLEFVQRYNLTNLIQKPLLVVD
ncbi:CUN055 hypothetical protein [Culex nigripalpus nucleopolyhedrovirus]|uniref:Uncharacterized protein n=1 Tax=Culex nigripalpus nucleopolyhedrovirus (isolate Florida/1997) TaxID=645993 RepID=Q919M0_NPVCO|nr:CUN055 hypothetical protein [Culex nigripalpus nucleopolyhedrovirus]AAK94133.1 CUN055 hypothetical protein [Culex nigripalpus nucleopolyhedrovirus]